MGSSFIAYGFVAAIVLQAGSQWLKGTGNSMEYYESWIIMLWGAVNTFTEHRGTHWSHKDLQHTSLGILWWSGGALGIWFSRHKRRSMIPAILFVLTGWAMSAHAQATETSTKVHTCFGYTLVAAGAARMIEIGVAGSKRQQLLSDVIPLQHLPPLLLVAAGLMFMSATDEELRYIDSVGLDYVTYILLLFSITFLLYTFLNLLLHLYLHSGRNAVKVSDYPETAYEPLEQQRENGEIIALDSYNLAQSDPEEFK